MPTPRRRSSRLRGSNATPGKSSFNPASQNLTSLTERDETPTQGAQFNLDYMLSSPVGPRTPATAPPKPSTQDMHPSRAHQSTTSQPDSGLRLGFTDIEKKGKDISSGLTQHTPSKLGTSATFDFQFARPPPQLSSEAQKMMDGLREQALQIKAKLAAEREDQRVVDENAGIGTRKFAQPKGKAGRYSDIHMAEFKKMDSIAAHPSAFRAQADRLLPTKSSLKRSQSKANLDEREQIDAAQKPAMMPTKSCLKRSQSKANLHEREQIGFDQKAVMAPTMSGLKRSKSKAYLSEREEINVDQNTGRLENTAPAKRARQNLTDDASSGRPVPRGDQTPKTMPSTPTLHRSQSNLMTSITTPTQASLARAATAKQSATRIPTLSRSQSKPNLTDTPRGLTKSATMSSITSVPRAETQMRSPGKLDRVKSLLRYPSSSKKPTAIPSSIPSLTRSPSRPNLHKELPSLPTTPAVERVASKHVNFTPDTINKNAATNPVSPSPFKSAIPRSASRVNLNVPTSKPKEVYYPSIANLPSLASEPMVVKYPSLADVRPLPQPPRQKSEPRPPPSLPGTFSFRSDHTIVFGSSPRGFGSSPGQSSLRQVRQSMFPGTTMPGSFPESAGNKENKRPLPSIPHGMSNKKRHRAVSGDEEEEVAERSPKKQKPNSSQGAMLMPPKLAAEKMAPVSKISSPAKKKGLSLSRLNMLSRPKNRK